MKAIGYSSIGDPSVLEEIDLPKPVPGPRDLLVKVEAISINPVDTKIRRRMAALPGESWRVLGWDVAGVVEAVGAEVTLFAPGDEVFYAGEMMRQGGNAEWHCVDERLAGHKPETLDWGQAASLPLTAVTAWELLFERLGVTPETEGALLVIGGAGGVGSMLIQLARRLTELTVIATASRAESRAWCETMGAHHVIDHSRDMTAQLAEIGHAEIPFIASLTASDVHHAFLVEILAPQGVLALIDDPAGFDIMPFKRKSATIAWEFMFTRSLFETDDKDIQGEILEEVARLADEGLLRPTDTRRLAPICAETLREAHEASERGASIGKTVVLGF